ncbi:hypothetical protein CPC16_011207, partial [Podila verticillata]
EMIKLWETQIKSMEKKLSKDKDTESMSGNTTPQSNCLKHFMNLRNQLPVHERPVLCPSSPYCNGFIQLTERELLLTIVNTHKPEVSAALGLVETEQYVSTYPYLLSALPPGQFLSNLMVPIGYKKGYRKQIGICSIIGDSIEATGKTWVLSGTFMTNGLELRVLAYDQRVFKKHEPEAAPGRTDKKTGNTRYLSEIRNVFKTPDDVASTFPNPPASLQQGEDVCIAGVDFGQVCTAAVSLFIPSCYNPNRSHDLMRTLLVGQKALMQPSFKGRRDMQLRKEEYQLTDSDHKGEVQELEQSIPPRKGVQDAEVSSNYLQKATAVHPRLHQYYNSNYWHRRTAWDMKKGKEGEYHVAIRSVLAMVEDVPKEKVLFVIGLGKFGTKSKLTSLHGTFGSLFVKTLRSLDYAVVGINEYYTSQKCPRNKPRNEQDPCDHGFVARVNTRQSYCRKCQVYFHQDLLASQNMIVAAKDHLTVDASGTSLKGRPLYLQPLNDDGTPRWTNGLPSASGG